MKIHLSDTVEGLKKFNARRKLKAVILAAVNSSKWYPYDDVTSDNFSDFGDEEVSSCGKFIFLFLYCIVLYFYFCKFVISSEYGLCFIHCFVAGRQFRFCNLHGDLYRLKCVKSLCTDIGKTITKNFNLRTF